MPLTPEQTDALASRIAALAEFQIRQSEQADLALAADELRARAAIAIAPGSMAIAGTDLDVVAYVNAGGHLVVRVNKAGICVADIGIANATAEFTAAALAAIGALMQPVLRDLNDAWRAAMEAAGAPGSASAPQPDRPADLPEVSRASHSSP